MQGLGSEVLGCRSCRNPVKSYLQWHLGVKEEHRTYNAHLEISHAGVLFLHLLVQIQVPLEQRV